jgi:hypothetical protein
VAAGERAGESFDLVDITFHIQALRTGIEDVNATVALPGPQMRSVWHLATQKHCHKHLSVFAGKQGPLDSHV